MEITKTEYWATYRRHGIEADCEVFCTSENKKIIDDLNEGKVKPEDIWCLVYDNDGFYGRTQCNLVVNEFHSSYDDMYKSGYAKVFKLEKIDKGIISRKTYFN